MPVRNQIVLLAPRQHAQAFRNLAEAGKACRGLRQSLADRDQPAFKIRAKGQIGKGHEAGAEMDRAIVCRNRNQIHLQAIHEADTGKHRCEGVTGA